MASFKLKEEHRWPLVWKLADGIEEPTTLLNDLVNLLNEVQDSSIPKSAVPITGIDAVNGSTLYMAIEKIFSDAHELGEDLLDN